MFVLQQDQLALGPTRDPTNGPDGPAGRTKPHHGRMAKLHDFLPANREYTMAYFSSEFPFARSFIIRSLFIGPTGIRRSFLSVSDRQKIIKSGKAVLAS